MNNIVSWSFVVILFLLALTALGLGIFLFVLAPTGAGIAWGCVACLASIGFGVGGSFLIRYILSGKSNASESIQPAP